MAGWGAWIRTRGWRNQNPLPYHLATPQRAYCRARPWRTLRKRPRAGRPRRPSGGGGRTITAGAAPGNVIARHRPDTGRTLAEPCRPLPGCIRRPKCAGRTLAAALPALPAEPTGPRASRRQRRCPPMADCLPAMAGRWAPIADSDKRRLAGRLPALGKLWPHFVCPPAPARAFSGAAATGSR